MVTCLPAHALLRVVTAAACGPSQVDALNGCCVAPEATAWHNARASAYVHLAKFMCANLACQPCNPVYIYAAEVRLKRPPKPDDPSADCCTRLRANCCEMWCAEAAARAQALSFNALRASLCLLALPAPRNWAGAVLPSACCGPWPCCGPHPNTLIANWDADYNAALAARTARFWAVRNASPDRYSFQRSPSGFHLTACIVEPVDLGHRGMCCCGGGDAVLARNAGDAESFGGIKDAGQVELVAPIGQRIDRDARDDAAAPRGVAKSKGAPPHEEATVATSRIPTARSVPQAAVQPRPRITTAKI